MIHPFAAECVAYDDPRVRRAALVAQQGRRILFVDGYSDADRPDIEAIQRSLAWAHLAVVRLVPEIPVDRRHNAKVDYVALKKKMPGS